MVNVSIPAFRSFTPAAIPPKPAPPITTLGVPSTLYGALRAGPRSRYPTLHVWRPDDDGLGMIKLVAPITAALAVGTTYLETTAGQCGRQRAATAHRHCSG